MTTEVSSVRGPSGVSVVICCHNSAKLLPQTLAHLKRQRVSGDLEWEVLLIDNASSDETAAVARRCWGDDGPAPLRIVHESHLGLSYARERTLREARYDIIGFVDDDNWVSDSWVAAIADTFDREPQLGALGSLVYPSFEATPPAWWHEYGPDYFALTLEPTPAPIYIKGAGMAIRKVAWQALYEGGFRSRLIGRKGKALSGGEDNELTMALRLSGWKLAVSPGLQMQHFMPSQRLQWNYLRKLVRGYAAAHVLLEAYTEHSMSLGAPKSIVSDRWWYQLARTTKQLASQPRLVVAALSSEEGKAEVLEFEKLFGKAIGLLRSRGRYGLSRRTVRVAHWRQPDQLNGSDGPQRRQESYQYDGAAEVANR